MGRRAVYHHLNHTLSLRATDGCQSPLGVRESHHFDLPHAYDPEGNVESPGNVSALQLADGYPSACTNCGEEFVLSFVALRARSG
jgi:hypothetical protein